jgi:hypothetical protein
LGRSVFVDAGAADVLVEVQVKPRDGAPGFAANLTLRAQSGNWLGARELQTDSARCSGLDEPLSLVLALMIDIPKDELPPPAEQPADTPPPAPRVLRVPAPPPPVRETVSKREPLRVELGVSGVITVGLLPDVALGARASVLVRPPQFWPVEFGALMYRDAEATAADGGSEFEAAGADISVCPLLGDVGRVRVLGCVLQSLGRLRVSGFGFDENRKHSRFYALFGARARLSYPLTSWLAGRLSASAEVPATRDDFYFVDAEGQRHRVFRSALVAGSGELGMELRF